MANISYNVRPKRSDVLDVVSVSLPGRDARLPPMYLHIGVHPQRPSTDLNQRSFIYFIDPSPTGKKHRKVIEKGLNVPHGRTVDLKYTYPGTFIDDC